MPRGIRKLQIGNGAKCTVLKQLLHPSLAVNVKYPNIGHRQRLENLLVVGKEVKRIRGKDQEAILFRHDDFDDGTVLYCQERFAKVVTEGPVTEFFGENANVAENVARLRAEGYGVDDDNEPAPENIPLPSNQHQENNLYSQWGSKNVCNRRSNGHCEENAQVHQMPMDDKRISWFLHFFPMAFLRDVIITETNNKMTGNKKLEEAEFLRFIGLLMLMATVQTSTSHRSWFEDTQPSEFEGAPFRLNKYMSRSRFVIYYVCSNLH
jgi:hypothetical protein